MTGQTGTGSQETRSDTVFDEERREALENGQYQSPGAATSHAPMSRLEYGQPAVNAQRTASRR